ncbi:MAG: MFS transporter [Fibromonadaceae bacterium]|jgi:MFS family permease|nr:MFS transporter [Fibromonadaceae bacterium]
MAVNNFTLIVIGQVISLLGSAMLRFALNLYVLDITGRADIFAAVIAISSIPAIIFSPIGGAIADRFNRRNLMVIFDFSSSAIVLLLILLMGTGTIPVAAIGAILTILAIISSMYQPAVQASVPTLVSGDQLAGANGIVSGVGALAGLLGPVLGGVMYGFIGLKILVIISCIAFFLSAVMEIFIRIPFTKRTSDKRIIGTILNDVKDGFLYIAKKKTIILKVVSVAAVLNLILTPLFIIGTPYILRVAMKSTDIQYGIGLGILQLSAIVGALSTGVFAKKLRISKLHIPIIAIALLLLPMAFAVTPAFLELGYMPSFALFFLFTFAAFFILTLVSVFVVTDIQKMTPNEMLGKVLATMMAVSQIAAPLGQALYGALFQILNDRLYVPLLFASVFTAVIALGARKLLRQEQPAVGHQTSD